jgi:Tfp pilus assembly protein PilO
MKIENRQQFLVLLVAISAALLIGNSLIYEPMTKWWSSRSTRIVELRKQVTDGRRLIKYEDSYRAQWAQMRTNTLPNNTSLAEQQVLRAFENWSRETGVTVTGILPQWRSDADEYQTLNCRVEASGSLGSLSRFLYEIEKDPMALKLDSVELSARDGTGQQLTLGLQVSGLVLAAQAKP